MAKEFEELRDMVSVIASAEFQKFIMKPMKDYRYDQKNNFFSDSVKDQWRKGGRVEAINYFLKILRDIEVDFNNKADELKARTR